MTRVTEFHVTYFGLSELETDALLDLYADHAYKFAERHKHETPAIGSTSYPDFEAWEASPNAASQRELEKQLEELSSRLEAAEHALGNLDRTWSEEYGDYV